MPRARCVVEPFRAVPRRGFPRPGTAVARQLALATTLVVLTGTAMAQTPWNYVSHLRACKAGASQSTATALSVGCEVLDVTLGCTANSQITVRMNFDAPAGFKAEVRLSNVASESLRELVPSGNARWADDRHQTLLLAPGHSSLAPFPGASTRVPLLTSTIVAPSALPNPARTTAVRLVMAQFVGSTRVAEASVNTVYHECPIAKATEDQIKQPGFGSSSDAVVLINGRRSSGCVPWPEVARGSETVFLGNLLQKGNCTSNAAIFSDSHAMSYRPDLTNWTDAANNTLTLTPAVVVKQRVKLWLLYDPCVTRQFGVTCSAEDAQAVKEWPQTNLADAAAIFKEQFGGVDFEQVGTTIDLSETQDAVLAAKVQAAWVPAGCGQPVQGGPANPTATTLDTLLAITGPTDPNQLNVFYVQNPGGGGVWCALNDPDGRGVNTILIGSVHDPKELAHELGHALMNLGSHVDDIAGFTDEAIGSNLMTTGTIGPLLTIGQLFRANVDSSGAINRHGRRTGPTTSCDTGYQCPGLSFDVRPRP